MSGSREHVPTIVSCACNKEYAFSLCAWLCNIQHSVGNRVGCVFHHHDLGYAKRSALVFHSPNIASANRLKISLASGGTHISSPANPIVFSHLGVSIPSSSSVSIMLDRFNCLCFSSSTPILGGNSRRVMCE